MVKNMCSKNSIEVVVFLDFDLIDVMVIKLLNNV